MKIKAFIKLTCKNKSGCYGASFILFLLLSINGYSDPFYGEGNQYGTIKSGLNKTSIKQEVNSLNATERHQSKSMLPKLTSALNTLEMQRLAVKNTIEVNQYKTNLSDSAEFNSTTLGWHCKEIKGKTASLQTDFAKLKLIGVYLSEGKKKSVRKALFLTPEQTVVGFELQDVFIKERLQIAKIDANGIQFIDWKKTQNCQNPTRFNLAL